MFSCFLISGQKKFDLGLEATSFEAEGKTLTGYSSSFDFTRDEVRKGWWRYARKFGSPLDMRTYYKVKIPSETTDGNIDLWIYTQTINEAGVVTFHVGLEESKYKVQVEELLREFKKSHYIQFYLDELKLRELEAERLSSAYESALLDEEKEKALTDLKSKQNEIEKLKGEIRVITDQ